jgi:antitoxin Phd
MADAMKSWPVQDAKARFSELLETCVREGPQLVTRRGAETAVLVPFEQWQQLGGGKRTLKELLLTDWARTDSLVPPRRRYRLRPPPDFSD